MWGEGRGEACLQRQREEAEEDSGETGNVSNVPGCVSLEGIKEADGKGIRNLG